MTLCTRVRTEYPVNPRKLFERCQALLGDPSAMRAIERRPGDRDASGWVWDYAWLQNDSGQGLDALLWVAWNPDGPYVERGATEDGHSLGPAASVEVSWSASYSYEGTNGSRVGDLHGWLVVETGAILRDLGAIDWCWNMDTRTDWHENHDAIPRVLGDPMIGFQGRS